MASGVKVHDDVKKTFDEMRIHHQNDEKKEQIKLAKFKIEGGIIVVDTILRRKDLDGVEDVYLKIASHLEECCYALYDCSYQTPETPKEDLIFILWCPAEFPVKSKMIYASSKDAIKKVFTGIKISMEMSEQEDKTKAGFLEKIRSCNITITALEGLPV